MSQAGPVVIPGMPYIQTLGISFRMNDVIIGHAHTPFTNLNTPAFNVIEMTMIDAHGVIRSSAAAGELDNTVLAQNVRSACLKRKTSNTTLLGRRKTELKQTRLWSGFRRIVTDDGVVNHSWAGRTRPLIACQSPVMRVV